MNSNVDATNMKPEKKRGMKPQLRFPEFRDAPEWDEKQFGEICKFTRGPFGGTLKKEVFVKDGYAVYEQSHAIHKNFESFRYYITEEKFNELKRFSVLPDDIIMSCSGTMGKFAIVPRESKKGVINQALLKLTVKKEFDLRFIKATLELSSTQEKLLSQSAGGAIKNVVSVAQIKEIDLYIPKSDEQQKIADFLSSLDDLIAAQTQKLDTLKDHKKGLLQQLFPAEGQTLPQLRFPEFRDAPEWKIKRLIDIADKKVRWSFIGGPFGSNLKASDYTETGIRIIQLQNIGDAKFVDEYKIFTSEQKADELISCNIYPGEIIFSKMGDPVARACLIPDNHQRYVMCSDGIRLVVNEKKNNKYFIYSYINSAYFRKSTENASTGSTRKRIRLSVLKEQLVAVPELEEQQKIGDCLFSLDEKITAQSQKLNELKEHKNGLMQQLFPSPDEVHG